MEPCGAPKPGSVLPALSHGEKERLNSYCSTDDRNWFNSQMLHDVLPQNATTESREVRVSRHVALNTTHRDSEQPSVSKTSSRPSSSVQKK